jgi:hypothetical protein
MYPGCVKRHPRAGSGFGNLTFGFGQALAERRRVHEPRERTLAVDLDDRDQLAIARLERRIAVDGNDLELERHVAPDLLGDFERGLAEVAAGGREEADGGYGYRPRVVVASATR